MKKYVEGIVFAIIGLVVLLAGIFMNAGIAVPVVGGLILAAGIIWIVLEIFNKNKNKKN